ncbi:hypothetical protein [Bacillus infantis]|uniref:hypothetical protein n=1 Tax=Bacillus infantis TaxID=324767 RepID=UPI002155A171|nr:hypothetical protein [Bacillus infantis]MCR6610459.1 hypothetical protein [Bacillus infantis]
MAACCLLCSGGAGFILFLVRYSAEAQQLQISFLNIFYPAILQGRNIPLLLSMLPLVVKSLIAARIECQTYLRDTQTVSTCFAAFTLRLLHNV